MRRFIVILVLIIMCVIFLNTSYESIKDNVDVSGKLGFQSSVINGIKEINLKSIDLNRVMSVANQNVNLSNKKIAWGIKRNKNNKPPEVPYDMELTLKKYNGLYIGDISKKTVYLTFDEGYENGYTTKILDILKEKKVAAAFFITGPYLMNCAEIVKRMVSEGHVVGNHTVNHPSLPDISDEKVLDEVMTLNKRFCELTGQNMVLFRPPKGEYSERVLDIINKAGMTTMLWSFAYDDWNTENKRGAEYVLDIVSKNLHNGAIILLHAVSADNCEALDKVIDSARNSGYEFATYNEFLEIAKK